MKPHIIEAHRYWEEFLNPEDSVIDATVGNGHDFYFLAQTLKGLGTLVGYDIQEEALVQTKKRLETLPASYQNNIFLKRKSHEQLDEENVKLIIYNLGYLPGANKTITTQTSTTLQSLTSALTILRPDGALSITCYPGHPEGAREEEAVLHFLSTLPQDQWTLSEHTSPRPRAPKLIWAKKIT